MSGALGKICPHCQAPLQRFELNESVCDHPFDLVCFNDDCPYYVRGWAWMEQHFGVKVSYRYRLDALTGHASPLAVWSPSALRESVRADDATGGAGLEEHA